MADRRRALPPWMAKKAEGVKEKAPLKSRRKPKAARAVFYCMNEKELVEAAVSFLTEEEVLLANRKVEDKARDSIVRTRKTAASSNTKPAAEAFEEESSGCSDAQEMTYVSETDLDITEAETVPYATSQPHQEPEGHRSGPVQDHISLTNIEATGEREERSQMPADAVEEDDALRLVREIFFT